MEQLNNLDVVFLIITGISALVGIARGMTKELLSLAGWVLAAVAVFYMVPLLDPIMQKYIASKILSSVVSGMLILIIFCIIWILTVDKISSVVRSSKLSALDRILGFAFGMARGIIIVILIAMMITTLIPGESKKGVFAESKFFNEAAECAEPLIAMVPQSWIDQFKTKGESLGLMSDEEKKAKEEAKAENTENAGEEKAEDGKETKTEAAKEDVETKTEDKDGKSEDKKDTKEKDSQENKPEILIKVPLDFIDSNLEMLQKSGEELFNQLAQPKTVETQDGATEQEPSDLDQLLDVLEENVVTTDEATPEMKSETQKIEEKLKEKLDK